MTLEQELQFFSSWTEEQRAMLSEFNSMYEEEDDVSSHPLINPSSRR